MNLTGVEFSGMGTTNYPEYREELMRLAARLFRETPDTIRAWRGMGDAIMKDGAIDLATKELIALGIAIAARCDGCIAYHVKAALDTGNDRAKIVDAIAVALYMGGGPSSVYGCEALKALDQFSPPAPK